MRNRLLAAVSIGLTAFCALAFGLLAAFPAWAAEHAAGGDLVTVLTGLLAAVAMPAVAVLVPIAVAGLKSLLPRIPKWAIPLIAALLAGPLIDQIVAALAGIEAHGWAAVLLGALGVFIREVVDQFRRLIGPPPG
jgi:hypothetical protein